MTRTLLLTLSMVLGFSANVVAQEQEVVIVSEIQRLPNGEVPTLEIKPIYKSDKVKEIEIYPFIQGKSKVRITLSSPSSRFKDASLANSRLVTIVSH